jgi:hypothetical protein
LTHPELARDLLAAFCGLQGAATIALDLNRTHASNPLWLRHARFHVVWQTSTAAALAAVEIALLFAFAPMTSQRFYLVTILAALPVFGFFAALVTGPVYGGALSDPNGIPPLILRRGESMLRIDMNLVAEIVAVFALAAFVWIYRH